MTESHSEYLEAWTRFRNEEWDGCSHLDCLPACRHATGNYHCERFEQAFALYRQIPPQPSEDNGPDTNGGER